MEVLYGMRNDKILRSKNLEREGYNDEISGRVNVSAENMGRESRYAVWRLINTVLTACASKMYGLWTHETKMQ